MKIPNHIAFLYQEHLALLAWDCYAPIHYLDSVNRRMDGGIDYSDDAWQLTVDMLYRMVRCGLLKYSWLDGANDGEWLAYEKLFSVLRRCEVSLLNDVEWWDDLCATESCHALIEKYDLTEGFGMDGYQLSAVFVDALEELFVVHEVPWTDRPLLAIVG